MRDWISVKELAQIQGITPRAVRKAVSNNKYVTRTVQTGTGSKYEIFVPSLTQNIQNCIDFEKCKNKIENSREPRIRKTKLIPTHAKQIALARFDLVNLWIDYKKNSNDKTKAGKEFIMAYNLGNMYPVLFKILGNVSIGTIYRWAKAIKQSEDYSKLIPNYDYGEKESSAKLTSEEELIFKSFLLSPNKTNIGKATKLTKFILNKNGYVSPTSERNFRRYADNLKNKHFDQWILAREGQKALRDMVEPYIVRDISKLEVGDVLVADGHKLAVQCLNPFTGKPCRVTLIGYLDWKSTALIGYEIMLEENTQAITSALRNAIINLGKIPKICYQDNGKAFRAKFFTGDLQECGINGLFSKLGITPVFAQPYNARAKVIERFFRELQDGFERLLPSFVGANIYDKPAYMMRNEKLHKRIADRVRRDFAEKLQTFEQNSQTRLTSATKKNSNNYYLPTLVQLTQMLDCYMEFHRSLECPNMKDQTIGEVLNTGLGEGVDINKLDDLLMSQEIKNIHRNGIRFLNADYYNDCLYGLKGRVIIKYSLLDLTKIKIYSMKNEFICDAERVMPIHPMENYLGDIKDREELKYKIKQQKSLEKQTIKKVRDYLRKENIKPLDWQGGGENFLVSQETENFNSDRRCVKTDTETGSLRDGLKPYPVPQIETKQEIEIPKPIEIIEPTDDRPSFEYRWQRYDWHLKNGFENDRDVTWFKEYELSDEYRQMYGEEENESKIC